MASNDRQLANLINRFISSTHPRAPLAGKGQMIVNVGKKYGVDPRLLAAIARKETEHGTTAGRFRHNPGGWGVHLGPEVNTSRSWEEGFTKIAKGLSGNLYRGSGLDTPQEIFMRYAPPSENNTQQYIQQVNGWMRQMGANPNQSVFAAPQVGTPAGNPRDTARQYAEVTQMVPGSVDKDRLWMLLENQRKRSLRGIMPAKGFMPELFKLAQSAMPRAETVTAVRHAGAAASAAGAQGAPALPASGQTGRNDQVVRAAQQHIGVPYSWGGGSPSGPSEGFGRGAGIVGFDCSSLVQYAWAKAGVKIPRVTYDQAKVGKKIPANNRGQWAPGDLLFSRPGSRGPEHVRMYIGGGKAIQAPRTGGHVEIISVPNDVYLVRRPS